MGIPQKKYYKMTHPAFKYIKAAQFFPAYAPGVKNWKHKLRGVDGNGKPISFTEADRENIRKSITYMAAKLALEQ